MIKLLFLCLVFSSDIDVLWRSHQVDSKNTQKVWHKDPFLQKPGFTEVQKGDPKLNLSAILLGEDNSVAIINGRKLYPSSRIEGFLVHEIGSNFVLLKKGRRMIELLLPAIENPPYFYFEPAEMELPRLPASTNNEEKNNDVE